MLAQDAGSNEGLALAAREAHQAVAFHNPVEQHEADVMAVEAVFAAGVAQADDEEFFGHVDFQMKGAGEEMSG